MSPQAGTTPAEPGHTVAGVLRVGLPDYAAEHRLPPHHWRGFRAITACRTPQLGGHLYQCEQCGTEQFVPHSCRNRHCPTCQGANGRAWMEQQTELLLPVPYFHLVFTLPHALNLLIRQNQACCYALLFDAASATLLEFGRHELEAQLGLTLVLHTWSQTLLDHYHVHGIVTGGGLRADGTWAGTPAHWLFPVRALSAMFRGKFKAGLQHLHREGRLEFHGDLQSLAQPGEFEALLRTATREKWIVYAKRPFAGPKPVLAYLARYTHRVGITNQRIRDVDAETKTVTFAYKDYADDAKPKEMTIACTEFVRRLRLHILPERFVKIRHYGMLSHRNRRTRIAQARSGAAADAGAGNPEHRSYRRGGGAHRIAGALSALSSCRLGAGQNSSAGASTAHPCSPALRFVMTSGSQIPPSCVKVGTFTPAMALRVLLRRTGLANLPCLAFPTIADRGSAVTPYPAGTTVIVPSLRVLTLRQLPRYFPL